MTSTRRATVRKRVPQRITTMLWGLLVVGFGVLVIAWLRGYEFDLQLAGIIALAALGTWILIAALMSGLSVKDD